MISFTTISINEARLMLLKNFYIVPIKCKNYLTFI